MSIDDRRLTAYHEAGHAVAAHRLGATVMEFTCEPEGRTKGHCSYRHDLENEDDAVIAFAGLEAQRKFAEQNGDTSSVRYEGSEGDIFDAWDRAEASYGTKDMGIVAPWMRDAVRQADEMVRTEWPKVEGLAKKLFECGTMSAAEVRAVIDSGET